MSNLNQELNDYYKFLQQSKIISKIQSDKYFKIKNITDTTKESILTKLKRQKMCFVDQTEQYYSTSPNIDYTHFTLQHENIIWCYLYYLKHTQINFANFMPMFPACAYFMGTNNENQFWDRTVFYLKDNLINASLRIIETNYGSMNDTINTTILVDDDTYLDKIKLSDTFKICEIITLDSNKNPILVTKNEYGEYAK